MKIQTEKITDAARGLVAWTTPGGVATMTFSFQTNWRKALQY